MIEQTLGHYLVLEKVGAGGMGVVYRAQDQRLHRDVALKVLPDGSLADEAAKSRFRQEALALSRLNHPNIATIFDFDTQGGTDFLVMEFVLGTTLAGRIGGKALSEKETAALGGQIADALQEAHELGIVHRDLKPGNIMVTPKGRVKVLDFGLAKLLRSNPEAADDKIAATALTLTHTQPGAGTPSYMAPEQLLGETVDARTDVHAFGNVLYEMATARRPFPETESPQLIASVLNRQPVAPRSINSKVSLELERIILKCLEKAPENRYQSAKEVSVDLRRLGSITVSGSVPDAGGSRKRLARVGLGIMVLAVLAAFYFTRGKLEQPASGRTINSLAVLPLANLSGDPSQEYFVDGMTEELITELSHISGLRVTSRTSIMQYKGTKESIPTIARALNADAILEGSVMRVGNQVRITTQLIDAATDKHLWARSYERDLQNVLAMQDDVARAVAEEIRVNLTPEERQRLSAARTVDPAAHEFYLRARYLNRMRQDKGDLLKSIDLYQAAIGKDPRYAEAYAGMATSYADLSTNFFPPKEVMPQAQEAARQALALDETLSEAHSVLARVAFLYDWDWAAADQQYQRSIQLAPNSADARGDYALYLSAMGRAREAAIQAGEAKKLDPLSPRVQYMIEYDLVLERNCKSLIPANRAFLAQHLGYRGTLTRLVYCLAETGQSDQAREELSKLQDTQDMDTEDISFLAITYTKLGEQEEARKLLHQLESRFRKEYLCPYDISVVHAALGHKEQAFAYLDKAYNVRADCIAFLKVEPRVDPLRPDPRFQEFLKRVKLDE